MEKISKYQILEEIGKGGMGVVYKAYDPLIERYVAIKVISEIVLEIPEIKARFYREARIAGKLMHENITIVHDFGEVDGRTYIVMEYLEGPDLRLIIDEKKPLNLQQKLDCAKQICKGLQFAHANKVIHRDIKPENIKILENGRVKIIDFGIAKPDTGSAGSETKTLLTQVGTRIGTPWYMSPEQVKGIAVDYRSDIFSFGVLFYEFLTYKKPFEGDDTTVLYRILHEEPEKIDLKESGLVNEIQTILSKCLEKNVDSRYDNCSDLLKDLETVLDKAQKERRTKDLLEEAHLLAEQDRLNDAILKFNEVLRIDPNHKEANLNIKRLIDRERESATIKILTGRIAGETISHFKIIERLGGGGMGVVYKAKDITLNRVVALKFLSPDLTRDTTAKKRFLKEARAASALDHPNIGTIHEINDTEDGLMFICMAYYEGEDLREKCIKYKMEILECLNVLKQIASGLAEAHKHSIVHRDIKPANIIITTEGQVKIVDFGLAKLTGGTIITTPGTTLGTLPYMSPEQVKGLDLDHRSDIWSFGVLIYEILTGKLPFEAEYEAAMLYSIVNENPIAVTEQNPKIPSQLEQVITKALKKEVNDRYASMQEVLDDLENIDQQLFKAKKTQSKRSAELAMLIENGKDYFDTKEYSDALSRFEAASILDPKDQELLDLIDQCKQKQEEVHQISKLLTAGRGHFENGKYKEALNAFEQILSVDPEHKESADFIEKIQKKIELLERVDELISKAQAYLGKKKFEQAIETYKRILEIEPQNKDASSGLKIAEKSIESKLKKAGVARSIEVGRNRPQTLLYTLTAIIIITGFVGGWYYWQDLRQGDEAEISGSVADVKQATLNLTSEAKNANTETLAPDGDSLTVPARQRDDNKSEVANADKGEKLIEIPVDVGELIVTSYPSGASVWLNGKKVGNTPYKNKNMAVNNYEVMVSLEGYQDFSQAINVRPNILTPIEANLAVLTGTIDITSEPSGASIILNGQIEGTTPYQQNKKIGSYNIILRKEGYEDYETVIALEPSELNQINGKLIALFGGIRMLVRPFGSIYIDDRLQKKDAFAQFSMELQVGRHKISVVHPTLGTWQKAVEIQQDKTLDIPIDFNKKVAVTILSQDSEGKLTWGRIYIDNEDIGQVTPKEIKVSVGLKEISVRREGYVLEGGERVINFEENMKPLKFTLKKIR